MPMPALLSAAVERWADYYDAHRMVPVIVRSLHLGALVVGGGTALAADRQLLTARRLTAEARAARVLALRASHRVVVPALALVVLTGLLMTASDLGTFVNSRLYWSKMSLVALLMLNGVALLRVERAAESGRPRAWRALWLVSGLSLLLWLVTVYFGVWLTAAA